VERAIVVAVLAIAMGSLFLVTFSLALADPVPHRINAGLVGDPRTQPVAVAAAELVARDRLAFRGYPSLAAALRAIDQQHVYAALDVASRTPTLYVASAAGVSVARVLERIATSDHNVEVIDSRPLSAHDPNGVEIYYLVLIVTVIGFFTIFQARVNAPLPSKLHRIVFVLGFAAVTSLVLTLPNDMTSASMSATRIMRKLVTRSIGRRLASDRRLVGGALSFLV
jgi:hypothetical protein